MTPLHRLLPLATSALTSPRTRALRRAIAGASRRLRGRARVVHYFHQADDPYSALTAQTLRAFTERYDVVLAAHLASPPSDAAAPERALLEAHSRRDAADVARGYWLSFPANAGAPKPEALARAQRILTRAIARKAFVECAVPTSAALWGGADALTKIGATFGEASDAEAGAAIAAGSALRERLGHYLGATFHYAGEWYWGVDRLHHLERRLIAERALKGDVPKEFIAPRPQPRLDARSAAGALPSAPLTLEFFASLRSPYTYIACERVVALAQQAGAQLVVRPVLPMVMRGLPVPPAKRLYILLDTKREAEDAHVPFGRICDPVGRPVERCFSLFPWARACGRGTELLLGFMRAAWAEGVDTGTDAGLRLAVERAGLAWNDARAHLDRDDGWRAELEANRKAMFELGLWGVPSFRVRGGGARDYVAWGQDRLWRVEEELRARRAGA